MTFRLEIEPHQGLGVMDREDTTTSEAIENVYREGPILRIYMGPRTWAILPFWGGVSDIYDDIIRMLKCLELGVYPFDISFLCSCFTAIWRFSESNGVLTIKTIWTEVVGVSNGREVSRAQFYDEVRQFVVEKKAFVDEWRNLLRRIKCDLLAAGYDWSLENFEYLESLD